MLFSFTCKKCNAKLKADTKNIGEYIKCAECHSKFTIPDPKNLVADIEEPIRRKGFQSIKKNNTANDQKAITAKRNTKKHFSAAGILFIALIMILGAIIFIQTYKDKKNDETAGKSPRNPTVADRSDEEFDDQQQNVKISLEDLLLTDITGTWETSGKNNVSIANNEDTILLTAYTADPRNRNPIIWKGKGKIYEDGFILINVLKTGEKTSHSVGMKVNDDTITQAAYKDSSISYSVQERYVLTTENIIELPWKHIKKQK